MIQHVNFIELIAVAASAITGILEARTKKMDIVGVFFVGMVTALGGGTVRDVLINKHPVFWIQNEIYPVAIFVLSLLAVAVFKKAAGTNAVFKWTILVLDALALGLFSIVGAQYAIEKECSIAVCVIMGIVTGTFGGVIRDIICNEIPSVFKSTQQLYATCAFFGAIVYVVLLKTGFSNSQASVASITGVFLMRLIAIFYDLRLPKRLS